MTVVETIERHGRARPGHPRLAQLQRREDVDARHKFTAGPAIGRSRLSGHDEKKA
jgi:hypothetical protein